MAVRQKFLVAITTDGMDFRQDMEGIAKALERAVPEIVAEFVCETQPCKVTWLKPKMKPKRRAR